MIDKGISYDIPQLAKPKGDGRKRQGYRGDAAAASGAPGHGGNTGGGTAEGRGDGPASGGGAPGPGDTGGSGGYEKGFTDQFGAKGSSPTSTGPDRDTGLERARQANIALLNEFKNYRPDINIPEFSKLPTLFNLGLNLFEKPLQKFSDFTTAKNRELFEDVIRAGNIPGLNFSNLTDIDIEQAYQDYMDDRMSGKTDAYGREINRDQGASGILQNLLMPLAPILESQEGITSIPSQSLNYAYTPFSNKVVIAPGTALGRTKVTI